MPKTILVVDDDPDICEIVQVNLEGAGYEVIIAADGAAGLQAAQTRVPDLIILDVLMPELDGWRVLEELVKDSRTADRPVIMLTCKGDDQDVLRGLNLGAVEYITKPFYPEGLVASVRLLLDRYDPAMREARRQQLIASRQGTAERVSALSRGAPT
ncbi:MAG TPA: response regulator [Chloroflexota bacterium]|nr:response regulator [Chloroflexota bacterium]